MSIIKRLKRMADTSGNDEEGAAVPDINANISHTLKSNLVSRPAPALPDVKLSLLQYHGKSNDNEVYEGDFISSMQFNPGGDFLAVGDRGGRITLYNREPETVFRNVNYKPYLVFQSHDPEFDYLKSVEIEEKVSQVHWVPRMARAQFLLASNDRTIKLWRIGDQSFGSTENLNMTLNNHSVTSLNLPRIIKGPAEATATLRKEYSNAHSYHVNTVAVNSDQETFLSSDDLRINLWNLEVTDQAFVIVDIKPENMDSLQEVITTSAFHPSKCNILSYSTSKGISKLCDMRSSALCDQHSKLFQDPANENPVPRGLFSEVVDSITDSKFSHSGRFLATRDYMKVKIWDTQMESKPVATFHVHDFLNNHLLSLYENDSIFDRFNVSWNGSDSRLVSGSYNNLFTVFERSSSKSALLEVPKDMPQSSKTTLKPKIIVNSYSRNGRCRKDHDEIPIGQLDFSIKSLYTDWHPKENILAAASNHTLYLFQDRRLFN